MWYRLGQQTEEIKSEKATENEIKAAKALLQANQLLKDLDDNNIKKILDESKAGFLKLKELSKILYDIGEAIPFLEPTLSQPASSMNDVAEQFVAITVKDNFINPQDKANLKRINQIAGIPTDLDSALEKVKKNLDAKDVVYLANLYGDFFILTGNPAAGSVWSQLSFGIIKIVDYRATWFPKLESDFKTFQSSKRIYDSTKDKLEKDKAWDSMQQSISGILGVISNFAIDLGTVLKLLAIPVPQVAPASGALLAAGFILQGASTLIDKNSPFYYKKIPSNLEEIDDTFETLQTGIDLTATGLANLYYGQPFIADNTPEQKIPVITKKTPNKDKASALSNLIFNPSPENEIYQNLDIKFGSYNNKAWLDKYNNPKTTALHQQPSFVIIKYANDEYGKKYPWLNMPNTTQYKNFVKYIITQKAVMREEGNQQPPSKRSLAAFVIENALNNQMTYKFTKPLITEMANKYTAGNIYNFLNKKNVEIIDLLGREMQNQNFAARYNVRPGNAGYDAVRIDIGNLKKILNTWK
jgi:hypothetical protein